MANADPRLITDVADLEGRTIGRAQLYAGWTDVLLLRFADGTACVVEGQSEDVRLDDAPGDEAMVALGLLTREDIERREVEARRREREAAEASDRRLYEQLKARFEGK